MLSKLYRYITHPPHNLDGENYPHFRNQTDKDKFTSDFIEGKPLVEVNVSLLSFDRATITITNQQTNVKLWEISGFKETKGSDYTRYWWVVGWQRSARTDAITFELQLDYWLTYWPLNTNGAICKITRAHTKYLYSPGGQKPKFYLMLAGDSLNPSYYTDEDVEIDKSWVTEVGPKITTEFEGGSAVKIYRAITINAQNNLSANESIPNQYSLTTNNKISSPGVVIFDKKGRDLSAKDWPDTNISNWSNVSYATNMSVFYLKGNVQPFHRTSLAKAKLTLSGDVWEVQPQGEVEATPQLLYGLDWLHYMNGSDPRHPELMYAHFYLLGMALSAGGRWTNTYGKNYRLFGVKNKTHYYFSPFLNDVWTPPDPGLSLLPIKMMWPQDTTDNTTLRLQPAYVTALSHLNDQLTSDWIKWTATLDFSYFIPKTKNARWEAGQEIKIWTYNCDYILNWSNQWQKLNLKLMASDTETDGFKVKLKFTLKQFLTLNNSFYWLEPIAGNASINVRQLFSFIVQDIWQFPLSTTSALKFYQQQGASYKVGLDQAQYQADYAKKYGALNLAKNIFTLGAGAIAGTIAGASKGMGGAIGAGAGGAIGFGLGTASGVMQYQNQMKQANYHLKQVKATAIDATSNPQYTSDIYDKSFNRVLTNTNQDPNPHLQMYGPAAPEELRLAQFYHQNGNRCEAYLRIGDTYFNQPTQRHQFNYWQIENIEQAIVKGNYPKMVIDYFNALFNRGVRLWNTFWPDVKFNDYTLANMQQDYYNTLPEK